MARTEDLSQCGGVMCGARVPGENDDHVCFLAESIDHQRLHGSSAPEGTDIWTRARWYRLTKRYSQALKDCVYKDQLRKELQTDPKFKTYPGFDIDEVISDLYPTYGTSTPAENVRTSLTTVLSTMDVWKKMHASTEAIDDLAVVGFRKIHELHSDNIDEAVEIVTKMIDRKKEINPNDPMADIIELNLEVLANPVIFK